VVSEAAAALHRAGVTTPSTDHANGGAAISFAAPADGAHVAGISRSSRR
jgi:hypothetical protein